MSRLSAVEKSIKNIEKVLSDLQVKTFSEKILWAILYLNKKAWNLPYSTNTGKFIGKLLELGVLKATTLMGKDDKRKILYSLDGASEYDIINGINRAGYFSHFTALYFHELTIQAPKVFYLSIEHSNSNKQINEPLTQKRIDAAFLNDQRKSSVEYNWNNYKIVIHQGKYTNSLGVKTIINKTGLFNITDIERTLIDCIVRPVYCGGVTEVLSAFEAARGKVDTDKLYAYLKKLQYIYPYHQSLGFYMERAKYPVAVIKKIAAMKKEFDFYLTYNIRQREYDKQWRLYFPKGL